MNTESLPRLLLLLILTMSVVFPTALQGIKVILLFLVLMGFLIYIVGKPSQIRYSKHILLWSLLFSVVGLIWSFYGETRANPGAHRVLTVMAIYPLLFALLGFYWRKDDAKKLKNAFIWIGFLLILSQALYIGSSLGYDGGFIYNLMQSLYGDIAVIDQGEDYFLFTLPNVSSLIFLLPFYFIGFLFDSKFNIKYLLLFFSSVVVVLLTGRRAAYLSFMISNVLIFSVIGTGYFISKRNVPKINRGQIILFSIGLILFVFIIIFIGLQKWDLVFEDIQSIFNFESNASNLERKYQFEALITGIQQNVLFGSGAGAAAGYARSLEQPWAYELSYVALLFQYGLLGFIIYTAGILYLVWWQIRFIFNTTIEYQSRIFVLSFLAGFLSLLVANATNPYLGKFDYMWVIFIPVMMINNFTLTHDI